MVKTCSKCKVEKDISNFKKRSDRENQYISWCIECKRGYDRNKIVDKLKNNPEFKEAHSARRVRDMQNRRQIILNYLYRNPCGNCGESDIEVLDFDHRDRNQKQHAISRMYSGVKSVKSILEEIAKCDVLCGNCHRHKTMHEVNSWRADYCSVENCRWA